MLSRGTPDAVIRLADRAATRGIGGALCQREICAALCEMHELPDAMALPEVERQQMVKMLLWRINEYLLALRIPLCVHVMTTAPLRGVVLPRRAA